MNFRQKPDLLETVTVVIIDRLVTLSEVIIAPSTEPGGQCWVLIDKDWLTRDIMGTIVNEIHSRKLKNGLLTLEEIMNYLEMQVHCSMEIRIS